MPVEIKFDAGHTAADEERNGGFLALHNPEIDEFYGHFPFHEDPDESRYSDTTNVWRWENPEEPVENITLHPSIILKEDQPNTFHIDVTEGEVSHYDNCCCGCE